MVTHPADYPWSSYRANAEGKSNAVLTPHAEYLALASTLESRTEAYRYLFRTELDPDVLQQIRANTNGGFVLGDDRFKAEIQHMAGRRVARGKAGRPIRDQKLPSEEQQVLFEINK